MPELLLGRCLLQVRGIRAIMHLLRKGIGPLPEVIGSAEFHGLNQRPWRLPLPGYAGGHHNKIGGVVKADVFSHLQGLGAIPMGIIGPQPLQGEIHPPEDCQHQARLISTPVDHVAIHLDVNVVRRIHPHAPHHEVDLVLGSTEHGVRRLNGTPRATTGGGAHAFGASTGADTKLCCVSGLLGHPKHVGSTYAHISGLPNAPFAVAGPSFYLLLIGIGLPIPQ
mmetsp:Transcript_17206/g.38051  ORF Transcript_17206/g.38051 Transcript_17206/m.38051 type:complete len:223 (-) Transcript_17206:304-972(-)